MPCLFTSTRDSVDLLWIGEVILLCPDGPEVPAETELQINGLICPRTDPVTVTFVHRGAIHSIRDRTAEWTQASMDPSNDWFSDRILNHPALGGSRCVKAVRKGLIELKTSMPGTTVASVARVTVSDRLHMHCAQGDHLQSGDGPPADPVHGDPIFSTFDLHFERSTKPEIFRVSFRTRHGLQDFGWQVGVCIQGPDRAIADVRSDIADRVEDPSRRAALRRRIDELFDSRLRPDYEVLVVGHPYLTLLTEERQDIGAPVMFPIESKGTPIPYAACPARVDFYSVRNRDFQIRLLANRVMEVSRVVYDDAFLESTSRLQEAILSMGRKGMVV